MPKRPAPPPVKSVTHRKLLALINALDSIAAANAAVQAALAELPPEYAVAYEVVRGGKLGLFKLAMSGVDISEGGKTKKALANIGKVLEERKTK